MPLLSGYQRVGLENKIAKFQTKLLNRPADGFMTEATAAQIHMFGK